MLFVIIGLFILLTALVFYKKIGAEKFKKIATVCLVVLIVGAIAAISFEVYFNNNYLRVGGYTCLDEDGSTLYKFVNLYTKSGTGRYYIVKENALGIKHFTQVEPLNDGEFYVVDEGDKIPMTQYGPSYKIKGER